MSFVPILGSSLVSRRQGFSPAGDDWNGWIRAPYAGSPWVGVPSAGPSGANDATEGVNPPAVGAALNAFATADFDGVNDLLTFDGTGADYWTNAALSGALVFNSDTAVAANPMAPYAEAQLLGLSPNGLVGLGFSVAGLRFWALNPAFGYTSVVIPCAPVGWHRASFRYDGAQLELALDGAWAAPAACGNAALALFPFAGQVMLVGNATFGLGGFFDGRLAEVLLGDRVVGDPEFANVDGYFAARYAL